MSTPETTPEEVDSRQPWLGLSSYRESDSDLFFGREKEGLELLRLVRREVITVLFGPSGTGKTSLLNAGLFPKLREAGFLPFAIRLDHSGDRPDYIGQIRARIDTTLHADAARPIEEQALVPPQTPAGQETLWEYLHRIVFWDWRNNPVTLVLLFDQFEEIFTLARNREALEEFLAALADLVENYIPATVRLRQEARGEPLPFPHDKPNYKVILSLREDFVSRLDGLRAAMPSVMHNRFAIARMNGEQALLAVREPGRGIVHGQVTAQIVRFVAVANRSRAMARGEDLNLTALQVDPALLSVVCRELNTRRIEQRKDRITEDLLEQSGTNILNDFYERGFAGLNPAVRIFVEDRLLTASGFRSTVPLEETVQAGIFPEDIGKLVDRRLIRAEERLGIPHLELTHDLLTQVVQNSRKDRHERERREKEERERTDQEMRRQAELQRARRWTLTFSGVAAVCVVLVLLAVRSSREAEKATATAEGFRQAAVEEKKAADEQRDRATKSAQYADEQRVLGDAQRLAAEEQRAAADDARRNAERQAALATSGRLAATALLNRNDRLDLAALLSIEAGRIADTYEARNALLSALQANPSLLSYLHHKSQVLALSFSPDGKILASGEGDGTIRMWNMANRQPSGEFLRGHTKPVHDVVFSPDGKLLASASYDDSVRLWDVGDRKQLGAPLPNVAVRPGPDPLFFIPQRGLAFDPSGKLLAAATGSDSVGLWDVETRKHLVDTPRRKGAVTAVAFSPDGRLLAFGSRDGTVQFWDVAGRYTIGEAANMSSVDSLAFSPDGKLLIAATGQGPVLWDVEKRQFIGSPRPGVNDTSANVAFSPDGKVVAVGGSDRTVRLWDVGSRKYLEGAFTGHTSYVRAVSFCPDGNILASASSDGTVRLWKVTRRSLGESLQVNTPGSFKAAATGVTFSPDGKILATGDYDRNIFLWDLVTRQPLERGSLSNPRRESLKAGNTFSMFDGLTSVVFSPDGKILASASGALNETFALWDIAARRRIEMPPQAPGSGTVIAVTFSRSGRIFASANSDGTVRFWDVATWLPSGDPLKVNAGITPLRIAFSAEDKILGLAFANGSVQLWDVASRLRLDELSRGDTRASARLFLSGSSGACGMAFSEDGKLLASAAGESSIQLWNLKSRLPLGPALRGHTEAVCGLAFSPNGNLLASASADQAVRLWDVVTRQPIGDFLNRPAAKREYRLRPDVAFSPDGTVLAAASADRTVWLWDVDPRSWVAHACSLANRNLSFSEWRQYLSPDLPYRRTCPDLPDGDAIR